MDERQRQVSGLLSFSLIPVRQAIYSPIHCVAFVSNQGIRWEGYSNHFFRIFHKAWKFIV